MVYTYELEYTPRKFMNFPSLKETHTFWKEQNKKDVYIDFFSYPLLVEISGDKIEDCDKKLDQLREGLFLHNPDLDAISKLSELDLRKLRKKLKQQRKQP